jgi:acyl carrier protein
MEEQVLAYVCDRVRQMARLDEATGDITAMTIDSTGLDSLELMELLLEVEDRFKLQIDDSGLTGSSSIQELCRLVSVTSAGTPSPVDLSPHSEEGRCGSTDYE